MYTRKGEKHNGNVHAETLVQNWGGSTGIYGAEWAGGSSSAWTRTDDAVGFSDPSPAVAGGTGSSPFDDIMPWAGMIVETDSKAGTVVKIPKFWYKWTRNGNAMKLQIANYAADGFYTSPAHADRGDGKGERDYVYIGRYHCQSNYKSASGGLPVTSITRETARTNIHKLKTTVWQSDFAMWWTIRMLYLVEFADWNSQAKLGLGCYSGSKTKVNTGSTDNMLYHTGTMQSSVSSYGVGIQYRHIEDLWANVFDWVDGIRSNTRLEIYCFNDPSRFADLMGGTKITTGGSGTYVITKWTDPSLVSGFEYALSPASMTSGGSTSQYITDQYENGSSRVVFYTGGAYNTSSTNFGLFYLNNYYSYSDTIAQVGCRLMVLP